MNIPKWEMRCPRWAKAERLPEMGTKQGCGTDKEDANVCEGSHQDRRQAVQRFNPAIMLRVEIRWAADAGENVTLSHTRSSHAWVAISPKLGAPLGSGAGVQPKFVDADQRRERFIREREHALPESNSSNAHANKRDTLLQTERHWLKSARCVVRRR